MVSKCDLQITAKMHAFSMLLVLFLPAKGLSVSTRRPPSIYLQPEENVYYKQGESVQLPCKADGDPRPTYRWKKNGIHLNFGNTVVHFVQLLNEGTLVINASEAKDEGIYQCIADNDYGTSVSTKINLRMGKLDDFMAAFPVTHTPRLGESVILNCIPPTSYPPAAVQWVLATPEGHVEPVIYDNRILTDLDGRLYITNVQERDRQGDKAYVCMATNYFMRRNTYDKANFIIPSGTKPDWEEDPKDVETSAGTSATFICKANGFPEPNIAWFINGIKLEESTVPIIQSGRFVKPDAYNITFVQLNNHDNLVVQCNASNVYGYVFADVYLSVLENRLGPIIVG
uniref:Peroxidasin-like protein n=1 Tax=Magallana gigas TaxID=29159 RepID=K1Q231_MAGGI